VEGAPAGGVAPASEPWLNHGTLKVQQKNLLPHNWLSGLLNLLDHCTMSHPDFLFFHGLQRAQQSSGAISGNLYK
jgi:hypothetical protein